LEKYLANYPKRIDAELLLNGFSEGFRLQYAGPRFSSSAKNLLSAELHQDETLDKLKNEIDLGRMLGPFSTKPISSLRISPIGLVQKSDNSWRLISHLSFPSGSSVNDFIHEDFRRVKCSSFDKVVEMISSLGRSAKIGKNDIRQAFRLLIINPADFDLMGITFYDMYYVDKCLPLGLASSCLFERLSSFLHWLVQYTSGIETLDHYLDDFIFAGSESNNNCKILMDTFMNISSKLGVPIAENKTVWPTTFLTFLGLDIDTLIMVVKIPADKLCKLKAGIQSIVKVKKIKLKDIESVVGLMAFCARAIPSARAFIRQFYDVISSVKHAKPYY
jgi:hypothetical protein